MYIPSPKPFRAEVNHPRGLLLVRRLGLRRALRGDLQELLTLLPLGLGHRTHYHLSMRMHIDPVHVNILRYYIDVITYI